MSGDEPTVTLSRMRYRALLWVYRDAVNLFDADSRERFIERLHDLQISTQQVEPEDAEASR
jgi:hypothetical protein